MSKAQHKPIRLREVSGLLYLIVLSLSAGMVSAQNQRKRPITETDYDSWRTIKEAKISSNGKFVAYTLVPEDGEAELVVRNVASDAEWRALRGNKPVFTADSRFVLFSIEPSRAAIKKLKHKPTESEEVPKSALGIMDLSSGEVTDIERVKSFQVPDDRAGFIAYQLEANPDGRKLGPNPQPSMEASQASTKKKEYIEEYGTDLVLRNTATNTESVFHDVLKYSFSKDAKSLVFTVSSKQDETNGVYVVTPQNRSVEPVALLTGKGKYENLTWDDRQTQLAFISDRDDANADRGKFKIYLWNRLDDKADEIVSDLSPGSRKDFVVSEKPWLLSFSLDGSRLFFDLVSALNKNPQEELADEDKVLVDLWHWRDDYILPIQKLRAERGPSSFYRAVYHIKGRRVVYLADESIEDLVPSDDGRYALGSQDRQYRSRREWDADYSDYYLIDTNDGTRKLLLRKQEFGVTLSPNARYAIYFDGKDWHSLSVPNGTDVNLTRDLGLNFSYEDLDRPGTPWPYGAAGWTKDDTYVLLYDRYDIWQVKPAGDGARNLTGSVGRREKTKFRYSRINPNERSIDPTKPLLLRAENESTRDTGYYRVRFDGKPPEKLVMAARDYSEYPVKAKDADVLMLTASRFDEFPDLLVTSINFKSIKKISNGDAQRAQFNWGTAELVNFENTDGIPLKGVLIKPENFDVSRKYPMIVYIYEKLSPFFLNKFTYPRPETSINPIFYASNGYLVFMPDIVYTTGYPGQSALKCVLPGVQAMVDKGFVNENAIGIQGNSWGGYQVAYLVTQTNRFKAAAAGAAVTNMTSAYNAIRGRDGLPRQFIYEREQSRIGGSLWEYPMRFLINSPVFWADRVQTPLLMISNDKDEAVPWNQGIEYYLALRRLGKEVYLFSYNGEAHELGKPQNQKDYTRRQKEFFDHFLKGAPAPEWMEKGIPYIPREQEKQRQ